MLRLVAPVRTDVSEERIAANISGTRLSEAGTTLAVTSNRNTLMMEVIRSSETSVLSRVTQRNILEDGILHSQRRENLKSYIALTGWALAEI
jgi:hypothetical protein